MSMHCADTDGEPGRWGCLLDLPRSRHRLRQVAEALRQKRSVIWRFPWTVDMEVPVSLVLDDCSRAGLRPYSIAVDDSNDYHSSPLVIAEKLAARWTGDYDLTTFADALAEAPWEITVVRGIENLSPSAAVRWFNTISELARLAEERLQRGQKCHRLLAVVAGDAGVGRFRARPFLREFWYWGWFTSDDLRLLADESHPGDSHRCDAAWLQAVGVELAGTDPALLMWMDDAGGIPHDGGTLLCLLKRYAEEKGWDQLLLQQNLSALPRWGAAGRGARMTDAPPTELLPLWAAGALDWHHEQGVVVHSAALAVLDRLEELEHRVWLGQARLLLPLIDRARVEVCRLVSTSYADWEGSRGGTQEESGGLFVQGADDEAVGAEFSELLSFLRRPPASTHSKLSALVKHVDGLRRARNTLAHYRSLDWNAFRRVWDDLDRCRSSTS